MVRFSRLNNLKSCPEQRTVEQLVGQRHVRCSRDLGLPHLRRWLRCKSHDPGLIAIFAPGEVIRCRSCRNRSRSTRQQCLGHLQSGKKLESDNISLLKLQPVAKRRRQRSQELTEEKNWAQCICIRSRCLSCRFHFQTFIYSSRRRSHRQSICRFWTPFAEHQRLSSTRSILSFQLWKWSSET